MQRCDQREAAGNTQQLVDVITSHCSDGWVEIKRGSVEIKRGSVLGCSHV
jgi:hypothetical protein